MSTKSIPNELTMLKTPLQKDVENGEDKIRERKSQWIQVRLSVGS